MTELAVITSHLSPPMGLIDNLCQLRETMLDKYQQMLELGCDIRQQRLHFPEIIAHTMTGNPDRVMASVTKDVDARLWREAVETCGFGILMNYNDLDELYNSLDRNPQPFTRETAAATLMSQFEMAETTFVDGLVSLFMTLDRSYKSNAGWKLGKRLILSRYRLGRASDLQRVLMILDHQRPQDLSYDELLEKQVLNAAYKGCYEGETPHLRWRYHQNGNTHIWCLRDDLLSKANAIIADHYGNALGTAC